MRILFTFVAGIILSCPPAAMAEDAKKQLDKLQGTWKAVSYEIGGTKLEGEAVTGTIASITIKGDTCEWKDGSSVYKGTIKIDPTKDPKHIDFVFDIEGSKITAWTGVYSVDGDALKFAAAPGAGQRPKDLSTNAVTYGVFTLKRSK